MSQVRSVLPRKHLTDPLCFCRYSSRQHFFMQHFASHPDAQVPFGKATCGNANALCPMFNDSK